MKKIYSLFMILIFFSGCQNKIDLPLNNSAPKLVIDAIIKWQKGTIGSNQTIKLTLTNDFYSNEIIPATGATVSVKNSSNVVFNFTEINPGEYFCNNFSPVINENYTLSISYKGENYLATNKLYATPSILNFEQETVPDLANGNRTQIKFFYQDNGAEDNYYLIGVKHPRKVFTQYGAVKDEFFQGNLMFGFYTDKEIYSNDNFTFSIQGISFGYFNYMRKLLEISGAQGSGNPFSTPPATLRGNIVNMTNNDNYPLGYFHLSEIDQKNYTVQ